MRRVRWRRVSYFVMQVVLITAGILMALLIDNLVEVRRQNELVAEAHAAIAAEIADNAKQLDNSLPSLDQVEGTLGEMLQAIDEILANGTTTFTCCDFRLIPPGLTPIGSHRVMAGGLRGRYRALPCYLEECPQAAPTP